MQIQATPTIIGVFYISGSVAQSVERESEKLRVAGSSPAAATCQFHSVGVWLNGRAVRLFLLALALGLGPFAEGYRL